MNMRVDRPKCARSRQNRHVRATATGLLLLSAAAGTVSIGRAARSGAVVGIAPVYSPNPAAQPSLQKVSPFNIIGFIQAATLDTSCTAHPFCGGTVTVNGTTVIVPQNTIFQMPAAAMTWDDMFANAPAAYKTHGQSGLALSDTPKPLTTYEITILGNHVINGATDQFIAALIYMSQETANLTQGFINYIDYDKGEIWVGKQIGSGPSGTRLRLNTPHGRFGKPDPNADPRFTSDEDNPTIAARSGYPMCIPRVAPPAVDPICPQWNRPRDSSTGGFQMNYTFPAAQIDVAPDANGVWHQLGYTAALAGGRPFAPAVTPDPFEQTPMEVGDFLTFAGTLTADPAGGTYISAHTVAAEVGIFTAPGTWPVYTTVGILKLLLAGTPNPLFPQEPIDKFFGEFFTTDSTQLLDIFAVDVDPCTGARTHRFYGTADPFGPPVAGVKGRARFRATIGNFLPPTREVAVASRSLTGGLSLDNVLPTAKAVANGLLAGQAQAPDFNFFFPDKLVLGGPPIPLPVDAMPFLVNGSGPYARFADGVVVPPPGAAGAIGGLGQLKPWPDFGALPASCTTGGTLLQAPVPNAGVSQTVASSATVTLDGSGSFDPNTPALPLMYTWLQAAGPAVNLSDPTLPKPTFAAPIVASGAAPVTLTFQLVVCNDFTCSATASVNITVNGPAGAPQVSVTPSPSPNVLLGTVVTLTAAATGGTAPLSYHFTQTAGPAQTLTVKGATATFTATLPPGTALPIALTFNVAAADSASPARTTNAAVTVFVGADTITVTRAIFSISTGNLQIVAKTNAMPKGAAVLTVTPLTFNGAVSGTDIICTYSSTLDTYTVAKSIAPVPVAVRIRSSYGGTVTTPVTVGR